MQFMDHCITLIVYTAGPADMRVQLLIDRDSDIRSTRSLDAAAVCYQVIAFDITGSARIDAHDCYTPVYGYIGCTGLVDAQFRKLHGALEVAGPGQSYFQFGPSDGPIDIYIGSTGCEQLVKSFKG